MSEYYVEFDFPEKDVPTKGAVTPLDEEDIAYIIAIIEEVKEQRKEYIVGLITSAAVCTMALLHAFNTNYSGEHLNPPSVNAILYLLDAAAAFSAARYAEYLQEYSESSNWLLESLDEKYPYLDQQLSAEPDVE